MILALALGICASTSSTVAVDEGGRRGLVMRIGDLDDVLPIVLGGFTLAAIRESSPEGWLFLVLQSGVVACLIALAGWLLVARASTDTEHRVFVLAIVLLLGGAAEYLSLSALLNGLIAGVLWSFAGGPARETVSSSVAYFQHPLMVLLLVVAGARLELSGTLFGLAAAYLALRTTAKVFGESIVRRIAHPNEEPAVGLSLVAPGIVGVAFALNVARTGGPEAAPVLAVAVAGALCSELIALLLRHEAAA